MTAPKVRLPDATVQEVRAGIAQARVHMDVAGFALARDPQAVPGNLTEAISVLTAARDLLTWEGWPVTSKHPTSRGISRLLKDAGFERAVQTSRATLHHAFTSGFRVTKDRSNENAVRVRHAFASRAAGLSPEFHRPKRRRLFQDHHRGGMGGRSRRMGADRDREEGRAPVTAETPQHTSSSPRSCPGCQTRLCSICARIWGRTAVHIGPDGLCANGHKDREAGQ